MSEAVHIGAVIDKVMVGLAATKTVNRERHEDAIASQRRCGDTYTSIEIWDWIDYIAPLVGEASMIWAQIYLYDDAHGIAAWYKAGKPDRAER